jgi:hypothetical protein
MSAKISLDLGTKDHHLVVDEAVQFFQGCTDALVEMGVFEYSPQMVELVEVIRVYPNQGGMSAIDREIIVEVVVSDFHAKKKITSSVSLKKEANIRSFVKAEVVKLAGMLIRELLRESERRTKNLRDTLNSAESA